MTNSNSNAYPTATPAATKNASVLICLPSMDAGALENTMLSLAAAFPGEKVLVASPELDNTSACPEGIELLTHAGPRSNSGWVLTAGDYATASAIVSNRDVQVIFLLCNTASPLTPTAMRNFADCIREKNADLVVPKFTALPGDGLVNSAILYPLSRTLFNADIRFPLPVDAAMSPRMLQRLATSVNRQVALGQSGTMLWPVAEAAIAGYSVHDVEIADLSLPRPTETDFNIVFSAVTASIFTDVESKAQFWQRSRSGIESLPVVAFPSVKPADVPDDVQSMMNNFRLAHANLQEIWSLVLAPQSRLALKKLSLTPAETFDFPPDLWARTVYDFVLAFHLRTINRGHLLGAMAPLYFAWAASHLRGLNDDPDIAAERIELTAAAFYREKPYLVSRWRWPDRFNP